MLGVVTLSQALKEAEKSGLDLVEISPNSSPPVCKILDFGKYKYEIQKKKIESKKKQKVIEVKEVQMRPLIDNNDFEIKCRAAKRFLEEGNKVKFAIKFRGREVSNQDLGFQIIEKIKNNLGTLIKIENQPKMEGKQIIMIVSQNIAKPVS